ncbi:GYD domain-containing protein [Saliphagus sp. LR7]|uniref:GYD domain-containing protein n=1 Tax=Saliphagus sp. LR7 TaxID=2282654 RepID=UPI000DF86140|nr:GYD domain-containing protein [Saliphagus sp. LR7]
MTTYASLVDATGEDIQNVQELAVIWGELQNEFTDHDAELIDSYAILGTHDFLIIFEVPDGEGATKAALTLRKHGLSTHTMEIQNTDDFSAIVDEI